MFLPDLSLLFSFQGLKPLPLGGADGDPRPVRGDQKTHLSAGFGERSHVCGEATLAAPSLLSKGSPSSTLEVYHPTPRCQTKGDRILRGIPSCFQTDLGALISLASRRDIPSLEFGTLDSERRNCATPDVGDGYCSAVRREIKRVLREFSGP